jgi:hypothetical protein
MFARFPELKDNHAQKSHRHPRRKLPPLRTLDARRLKMGYWDWLESTETLPQHQHHLRTSHRYKRQGLKSIGTGIAKDIIVNLSFGVS